MIDKETFIDTINFLEIVVRQPKDDMVRDLMIKKFFILLPIYFPDPKSAKIELEHYCFDINFGKPTPESEYITPGELYEKLI